MGYSSAEGIVLSGSVSQQNIFGSGNALALSVNTSRYNTLYSVVYTEPYWTTDGTAKAGSDYTTKTGTLSFAPGELTKNVIVNASAAAEELRASGGHIKEELEAFAHEFIETFDRLGKTLLERVEQSSSGMGGSLEELTASLASRIDDRSNDLLEKFAERTLSVVSELESASGEIAKKLNDTSNRYTDLIETTAAKVGEIGRAHV